MLSWGQDGLCQQLSGILSPGYAPDMPDCLVSQLLGCVALGACGAQGTVDCEGKCVRRWVCWDGEA